MDNDIKLPPPINTGGVPGGAPSSATDSVMSGMTATPSSESGTPSTTGPGQQPAPVIKRRAPIACRRCRRMRSKCIHDKGKAPCKACSESGLSADDCVFPVRGMPDNDRDYRHPRLRADKASSNSGGGGNGAGPSSRRDPNRVRREILEAPLRGLPSDRQVVDEWDYLPPLEDIIEAVNRFTRHYFQLGFIPKEMFPERLRTNHRSVSPFLLLAILSISSRFTPSLIDRHGDGLRAVEYFMERASTVALDELYREPTLERCQAFYLLSIAQQGSGLNNRSYINMGIAMRMAALMQLHREETYHLDNPTPELIVRAESARRTLWMLHSQDNLHSGPSSPVSLAASDITALLPCNEDDFARGREPFSRAALEGTPPALEKPHLMSERTRSLFASLIQTHHHWGSIARRVVSPGYATLKRPWEPDSEYQKMKNKLNRWEDELPHEHLWSPYLLKGYKTEGQDLAYLGVTMVTRLCNMVLRRLYLKEILKPDTKDATRLQFWQQMAHELSADVRQLYAQIEAQFTNRAPEESVGAQMAAFCVYSCGLFLTYLVKYPHLCEDKPFARDASIYRQHTLDILQECKGVWPLATRWVESLEKFSCDLKVGFETGMARGRDPIPQPLHPAISPAPHSRPPLPPPPALAQMEDSKRGLLPSPILPPPVPHPQAVHAGHPSPIHAHAQHIPIPPPLYEPPHQHQQLPRVESQQTDGVGLLISAFDTSQYGAPPLAPAPLPLASGMAAIDSIAYYGPDALMPGNDGFDNELQLFLDGSMNLAGTTGLYGY